MYERNKKEIDKLISLELDHKGFSSYHVLQTDTTHASFCKLIATLKDRYH